MQSQHAYAAEVLARAHALMIRMDKLGMKPLRGARCAYDVSSRQDFRENAADLVRQQMQSEPSCFRGCFFGLLWALCHAPQSMTLNEVGKHLGFSQRAIGALIWANDIGCSWKELAGLMKRVRSMRDDEVLSEMFAIGARRKIAWADALKAATSPPPAPKEGVINPAEVRKPSNAAAVVAKLKADLAAKFDREAASAAKLPETV
jgi:hypothetical protein